MTAMATTVVTNDSSSIYVHMCGIPMVQHFRAHVCHTHGAERTRTYRAHTRVHVHIPCTYTPSACISDFDAVLNIDFGSNFVFFRPGSKVILRICWENAVLGRCTDSTGGPHCVNLQVFGPVELDLPTSNCGVGPRELQGGVRWIFQLSGGVADCVPVAAVVCEIGAKTRVGWQ